MRKMLFIECKKLIISYKILNNLKLQLMLVELLIYIATLFSVFDDYLLLFELIINICNYKRIKFLIQRLL